MRKPTIRMWPRVYLVESCRHETTGGTHRAISQVGTTNVLVGALRLLQRSKSSSNTSVEWMEGGSCSKLTSSFAARYQVDSTCHSMHGLQFYN